MSFIHEAGWGIYPVLLFGVAGFAMAVRQLLSPSATRLAAAKWLMALTAIAGVLGAVTGVQKSVEYIGQVAADERWIFLLGLRESLHNVTASLVIVVLTMLVLLWSNFKNPVAPRRAENHARAGGEPSNDAGFSEQSSSYSY
jgi:hypothetical protein